MKVTNIFSKKNTDSKIFTTTLTLTTDGGKFPLSLKK
nr:MAG TPA: hypothetical protein [Caudoviricetes sp.]